MALAFLVINKRKFMYIFNNKIVQHIPKTAGTALKVAIKNSDHNISFTTTHKPLSFLSWPELEYAKDFEKIALVRRPDSWYRSWWNYHRGIRRTCALTNTLLFDENDKMHDINTFISRASNLTLFFKKNPKKIQDFKNKLKFYPSSHLVFFLPDASRVDAEYFKNQSLYSFILNKQIDDTFRIFRFEDQMDKFLEYIDIKKLPKKNVTQYTHELSVTSLNIIKKADKNIYDKYYR